MKRKRGENYKSEEEERWEERSEEGRNVDVTLFLFFMDYMCTPNCPISVGYYLELWISITFHLNYINMTSKNMTKLTWWKN